MHEHLIPTSGLQGKVCQSVLHGTRRVQGGLVNPLVSHSLEVTGNQPGLFLEAPGLALPPTLFSSIITKCDELLSEP